MIFSFKDIICDNKTWLRMSEEKVPFRQWRHLGGGGAGGGAMAPLISGGAQFQPRNSLFIRPCSTFFSFFFTVFLL